MSGAILKPSKMRRGMWVYVGSGGVPRLGPGSISQGLRASDEACGRIGQATSANVRRHQPRVGRIGRGLCTTLSRRRAWPARMPLACTQRSADVGRGLPASPLACTHRSVDVKRGLPTSPLACAHRSADVGRGMPASGVA
ncbi:hypothetical protein KY290_013106 [Solanum tuberosum]|uniref:Uncharacterized protein n=1 Tax=Solanum tuberosum TaxID=4113 RepID=A0ABQ7VN05_SOLTU|nr:hypothetical protein KY290_013106 [Solanum tuberosum]